MRDYSVAQKRNASRGSPRFPRQARDRLFTAQRTIVQDDNRALQPNFFSLEEPILFNC
jgi:hypothetical protein